MNNQFLNQTIKFIEESDLALVAPSIRPITFNEDGTHELHFSFSCREARNKLKENALLSQMIMFTLFDALLDSRYPENEGCSFKKRYLSLPENTAIEVVTKEIYRIFKLVRNAMVHNRDSFNMNDSKINIKYSHRGTEFELICKPSVIQYMNSIIFALSKNIEVNDKYFELYILSYYNALISNIDSFLDDIPTSLKKVVPDFNFKYNLRYRVPVEESYNECRSELKVPDFSLDENEHWAGIDYVVKSNNSLYIIPSERLVGFEIINKKLLSEWRINDKNTFAM